MAASLRGPPPHSRSMGASRHSRLRSRGVEQMSEEEWKSLLDAVDVNPVTGTIIWKYRDRSKFETENEYQRWNSRYAHQPAANCVNSRGYKCGSFSGRSFLAHRLIWAAVNRDPGALEIDHINGRKHDNRIENLRAVGRIENCRNSAMRSNNTSGVTGVHKAGKKWVARIGSGKKRVTIGSFESFDDAVLARRAAEVELGYSQRHGRPIAANTDAPIKATPKEPVRA